ncbi:pyocin knob domain-containing protein [Enterobacter cloacae]|uniref:pyocin knob domain-containing protein n=1 Tax=Enterobacter cloacae TaxID=550 RepID=UPI00300CD56A
MILGFGNNVVSALASEITASQKTIPVMPGTGDKFEALLTQDNANSSTDLKVFAKITLTDSGETEFEICHLLSVSGDVLSVLRGQEGTAAKGWMLNDVVANFATRGSENQFVQVDHLQSGFYCAGVAGGSANALTLSLPSSFFLNGATDWMLRTPVIVYPTQNNTGAATLQLTIGGVVLGTFPLYKGDKKQLVANDILKDVALVCLLDFSKTFFNVSNPGAIYAGLGTAAFLDVTTSARDTTPNRVLKTADYGIGRAIGTVTTGIDFKSFAFIQGEHLFVKMDTCTNIPAGLNATTYYYIFVKGMRDSDGSPCIELVKYDNPSEVWNAYGAGAAGNRTWTLYRSYNSGYKQTAEDIGAMPYFGTALSVDLNTLGAYSAAGVHYQPTNAGATTANHYPVAEAGALLVLPSAYGCQQEYTTFGTGRKFLRGLSGAWNGTNGPWGNWNELYGPTNPNEIVSTSANSYRIVYGDYGAFWRQDGGHLYLMLTNRGDQHGNYNALRPFYVDMATGYPVMSRLSLTDYTDFDARYNAKYPAQFRVGARVTYKGSDFFSHVPQGAVNINNMTDGDDRINGVQYAYLQYNLNGNWVNFA